jgi:hypothetical protein
MASSGFTARSSHTAPGDALGRVVNSWPGGWPVAESWPGGWPVAESWPGGWPVAESWPGGWPVAESWPGGWQSTPMDRGPPGCRFGQPSDAPGHCQAPIPGQGPILGKGRRLRAASVDSQPPCPSGASSAPCRCRKALATWVPAGPRSGQWRGRRAAAVTGTARTANVRPRERASRRLRVSGVGMCAGRASWTTRSASGSDPSVRPGERIDPRRMCRFPSPEFGLF